MTRSVALLGRENQWLVISPHEGGGITKAAGSVLWIDEKLGSQSTTCAPELAWRHHASPDLNEGQKVVESNQIDSPSGPRLIRDVGLALTL
jgi:hypothetical protein